MSQHYKHRTMAKNWSRHIFPACSCATPKNKTRDSWMGESANKAPQGIQALFKWFWVSACCIPCAMQWQLLTKRPGSEHGFCRWWPPQVNAPSGDMEPKWAIECTTKFIAFDGVTTFCLFCQRFQFFHYSNWFSFSFNSFKLTDTSSKYLMKKLWVQVAPWQDTKMDLTFPRKDSSSKHCITAGLILYLYMSAAVWNR